MSVFVDTNVLVYARDPDHPEKHEHALEWVDHLWTSGNGRVSAQVLNEYYVTVTRRLTPGLSHDEARTDIEDLFAWNPQPIDTAIIQRALGLTETVSISYWDALIVLLLGRADRRRRPTGWLHAPPDRGPHRRAAHRHRHRDQPVHPPARRALVAVTR